MIVLRKDALGLAGTVVDSDNAPIEGARVALVYATENPDYLAQLAPPATIEAARAGLAALAAEFPDTTIGIGPDAGAAHDDFVDFVHPGAKGYRRLAGRIAPALVAPQAAPAR